jgi:ubiquinone/menaquinone biosynthesis C-methylase UbiE
MRDAGKLPEHAAGMAAYYDRLAAVYGDGEVFAARRAAVLSAVAAELTGARAVLDLGCGNGTYAAEFCARAPAARVVGADLSPEMLQAARRRLGERSLLVRGDATALPFRAACFDLVFMSHVLQLVDDIERCVADIATCLASGGLWITTVGVSGWRETVGRLLGAEALQELAALVASTRSHAPTDDQPRVAAACARAGLQPAWRSASFSVTWPALEEWLRIRWLTILDEAARVRVEAWLEQPRPRSAGLTASIAETLLVARKP